MTMDRTKQPHEFAEEVKMTLRSYGTVHKFKTRTKATFLTYDSIIEALEYYGVTAAYNADSLTVLLGDGLPLKPVELMQLLAAQVAAYLENHGAIPLAQVHGVSERTAKRWRASGEMPAKRWPFWAALKI